VARLAAKRLRQIQVRKTLWPPEFANRTTGMTYRPHNEAEAVFVYDDVPRNSLLKGGEGSGKSTAGIVKDLLKIRRGCDGILASPDFEHFKKSIWPEFCRWCPPAVVIPRLRYRLQDDWEPTRPFRMTFTNADGGHSFLICGGCKEDEIGSWEGPNVNFVHLDEIRRHKTPVALKTFSGRARIAGPKGEPPQVYLTTTPRKHWLWEFFGPIADNDPLRDFKLDSYVATLLTEENEAMGNVEAGFTAHRRQSLTEAEARVLLSAEWEDETDTSKFVQLIWWDACREPLPPLTRSEPLVIAADAATGGKTNTADTFAVVAVSRHPGRPDDVAVRYCGIWLPPPGGLLDFLPIEIELRRLCREFSVIEVAYDKTQLHDMMTRLAREGVALTREFPQGNDRLVADKQLLDLILGRRVAHDGNPLLRQHVDNADVKKEGREGMRIVKRAESLKVDAAVALSMACARRLHYVA
jgi:hypothetical protein